MNRNYIDCGYYVTKLISDALTLKQNNPVPDVKYPDILYSFCKNHKLQTILCSLLSRDTKGCEKLIKESKALILAQTKRAMECDRLSKKLDDAAVSHIVQKGTTLQKFYPSHIVRDSSDIDLYVPHSVVDKAKDVIESDGYSLHKVNQENEFCYLKEPRYYVELHTKLSGFNDKQKAIFNSIAEKTISQNLHSMSDSDSYITTLFHLYKHLILSGVGVRMFLDVYLIKQHGELDREYVESTLDALGILCFEKAVSDINAVLFEGKAPNDKQRDVIEFIFESGIYGTFDMHNNLTKINGAATAVSKKHKFSDDNGISYSAMSKRYPLLKTAPYLYPFSFVHRFFYGITNRRDSLKKASMVKKSISQDKVSRYKEIFDTLHIDT